jgi:hypothetical protein
MSLSVGKSQRRLDCAHHGHLGNFTEEGDLLKAADEHFRKRHADKEGVVAPLATVTVSDFSELSPGDVASASGSAQK